MKPLLFYKVLMGGLLSPLVARRQEQAEPLQVPPTQTQACKRLLCNPLPNLWIRPCRLLLGRTQLYQEPAHYYPVEFTLE